MPQEEVYSGGRSARKCTWSLSVNGAYGCCICTVHIIIVKARVMVRVKVRVVRVRVRFRLGLELYTMSQKRPPFSYDCSFYKC